MAQWRVDINYSFLLDSDDLDNALFSFQPNRTGAKGELLAERILLDRFLIEERLDVALRYNLTNQLTGGWNTRGTQVGGGADGNMVEPSEFRSVSYAFTPADVGRIIFVPAGQAGFLNARGHYKIIAHNGPNSVTIDGILPRATTANLDFQIHSAGDAVAVLLSKV
jgi:hypothetical protein